MITHSQLSLSYTPSGVHLRPGAVFTKGLSQVLGLSWLYFYTKVKPKTWLRPFVNTAPGYREKSADVQGTLKPLVIL